MAVYGQGQMLGAGVDPRMFVQDYSGFTRAAEIQAQGMQNLGAMIGKGIADFGEARKERKKIDAEIKATSAGIESAIKMGKDLGIDVESYLAPVQAKINDPSTSPIEALALGRTAAQGISNAFSLGIGAQERQIAREKAMADAIYKQQQLGMEERRTRATEYKATQSGKPSYEIKKATVTTPTGEVLERDMPFNPKTGRFFDAAAGKEIQDINAWGLGQPAYAEDMPPTSQVGGGSSDMIAQVAEMNLGQPISAKTPGTQGGKLGCADAVCKLVKQATGEEIGTLSTAEMVSKLSRNPKFESVPIGQAQRGDIIVTPRGNRAGHAGVFLDSRSIASNSSAGFRGGSPGTLQQNYTLGTWMNSIDSRNPGKTQVFRYTGGDAASQAMGTPEQQAEIARMIQEGAGMATAQMIPRGSMPTEPRMAQPQPAVQQAPQYQVRPGFVPVRPAQKAVQIVTGEEAKKYNLPPTGTYEVSLNPDGSVADTEKIIAPINEEQAKKETKIEQEQALRAAADAAEGIRIVNKLTESSGFAGVFGAGIGLKYMPGTETRTAENYRKKLVALATTDTMRKFQGLGQMSDREFGVAQDSATMLADPGISEEAAAAELNRLRSYFATSIRRAEELGRVPKGTAQKLIGESMGTVGTQGGQSSQATSDASFIQGFQGAD